MRGAERSNRGESDTWISCQGHSNVRTTERSSFRVKNHTRVNIKALVKVFARASICFK